MNKFIQTLIFAFVLLYSWSALAVERIYQLPEEFVTEIFVIKPSAKVLWLNKDAQAEIARILGHAPSQLRQRYWSANGVSLWIMEEIGKEEFITAGFVVQDGRIKQAKILVYRESRGMEVRYPAFLNQFTGVMLNNNNYLDRNIDGISGATLSVHAMQRMARVVLYLDQLSRAK